MAYSKNRDHRINTERKSTQRPPQQAGAALLVAILVAALATTVSAAVYSHFIIDLRRTENLLQVDQATRYAMAAETYTHMVLRQDAQDDNVDGPKRPWLAAITVPVEEGVLNGRIHDLSGCFNVNDLNDPERLAQFERLLDNLEVDRSLAQRVADWVDTDSDPRAPFGAEDGFYLGVGPLPYRTGNQAMETIEELRLLFDATSNDAEERKTLQRLLDPKPVTCSVSEDLEAAAGASGNAALLAQLFGGGAILNWPVCALPSSAPLNINMATSELLMALHSEIDQADAEALQQRICEEGPFADTKDFFAHPAMEKVDQIAGALDVQSRFFLTEAHASVGNIQVSLYALLERDPQSGKTTVHGRSRNIW